MLRVCFPRLPPAWISPSCESKHNKQISECAEDAKGTERRARTYHALFSTPSDGIQLVDEDDRRSVCFGGSKELLDLLSSDSDVSVAQTKDERGETKTSDDRSNERTRQRAKVERCGTRNSLVLKLRSAGVVERHSSLVGDRTSEHRLSRSGRSSEQNSLIRSTSEVGESHGVLDCERSNRRRSSVGGNQAMRRRRIGTRRDEMRLTKLDELSQFLGDGRKG